MRQECTIGVKLERHDREGYVKPFFYNLPYSKSVENDSFSYNRGWEERQVIDSKCLGIMFTFFYALSEPEETDLQLRVIVSDEKEEHEGWIELHKKFENYCEYEVHGLSKYKGEERGSRGQGLSINLQEYYPINNPEYIYLKKL